MKKSILFLILFSILIPSLFANRSIGFSLTYSQNMEFPQKLVAELDFTSDNLSIYAAEHSGQKLQLGATYNIAINRILNHKFLIDTSLTYDTSHTSALSGWSGLGYMLNAILVKTTTPKTTNPKTTSPNTTSPKTPKTTTHVTLYLDLSLGVQLAVAYSPYFATALFSITPICEAIAGIQIKDLEVQTYMSFITAQAKEWKAVPTIGAKALLTIKDAHRLGGEVFMKFAEFLTDTSTLVSAFGVRVLYEYKISETTKRATNASN